MFSLFKSAFSGRNKKECPNRFPTDHISFSIFKNYRNRSVRKDESNATDLIEHEMRSLEDSLRLVDDDKRYDLICAALRRIEKDLR